MKDISRMDYGRDWKDIGINPREATKAVIKTGRNRMSDPCRIASSSGFEHSIANQSLLSMAMFLPHGAEISLNGFFHNQVFVTLGNLVGGGAFVGLVYWLATPSMQTEAGHSLQAEFVTAKK